MVFVFFPAVSPPLYNESLKKAFYCLNVKSKFPDSGLLIHKHIDFEKGSKVVKRQFVKIYKIFFVQKLRNIKSFKILAQKVLYHVSGHHLNEHQRFFKKINIPCISTFIKNFKQNTIHRLSQSSNSPLLLEEILYVCNVLGLLTEQIPGHHSHTVRYLLWNRVDTATVIIVSLIYSQVHNISAFTVELFHCYWVQHRSALNNPVDKADTFVVRLNYFSRRASPSL